MSTRHKGIIAYGTEEDRAKLAKLAELRQQSGSQYVIDMIRSNYAAAFGDAAPEPTK